MLGNDFSLLDYFACVLYTIFPLLCMADFGSFYTLFVHFFINYITNRDLTYRHGELKKKKKKKLNVTFQYKVIEPVVY